MRARLLFLAVVTPFGLHAQVVLSTLSGSVETPISSSSFNFGSMAPLATKDVTFVARGTGSAAITITQLALSGIGFAIVNTSTLPYTIAPGNAFDFTVRFTGGPVGSYSANLQVNTAIVALQGTVAPAGTLTLGAPCTGPDSQNNISFGRVAQTLQVTCNFTLSNPYTQALTVSPIALTGAQFETVQASSASIPAGQSITFSVIFTAATAATYTATLVIGVQTFYLSGTGFLSPLPAPILTFDTPTLHSGEQHTLTAALPSPAPVATNGTITMSFTPGISGVVDDAAVEFVATGNRSVPFSVSQGSTTILLNNQSGVVFSTGTTAGTIAFTVSAGSIGISGNATTTVSMAPAPVDVIEATATTGTAALNITITGFDNTFSIGQMTFTFYDLSGKQLGASIPADFSTQFHLFYEGTTSQISGGSAFLMSVSFPVTGNESAVGSVQVQMNNIAGTTTVSGLDFSP